MNAQPKQFNYDVVVSELENGKSYALLRYDNLKTLPVNNVVANQATSVTKFVANGTIYTKKDNVMSNKMVFYRCVDEENLG